MQSGAQGKPSANELVQQGIAALQAKDKATAQKLLAQAITLDSNHEQAWLWLSGAIEPEAERRYCLERVLAINSGNTMAQKGLKVIKTQTASVPAVLAAQKPAAPAPAPAEAPTPTPAEPSTSAEEPAPAEEPAQGRTSLLAGKKLGTTVTRDTLPQVTPAGDDAGDDDDDEEESGGGFLSNLSLPGNWKVWAIAGGGAVLVLLLFCVIGGLFLLASGGDTGDEGDDATQTAANISNTDELTGTDELTETDTASDSLTPTMDPTVLANIPTPVVDIGTDNGDDGDDGDTLADEVTDTLTTTVDEGTEVLTDTAIEPEPEPTPTDIPADGVDGVDEPIPTPTAIPADGVDGVDEPTPTPTPTTIAVADEQVPTPTIGIEGPDEPEGYINNGGNIRSEPVIADSTIIGQVCPGDLVGVLDEQAGWLFVRVMRQAADCHETRVDENTDGWVSSSLMTAPLYEPDTPYAYPPLPRNLPPALVNLVADGNVLEVTQTIENTEYRLRLIGVDTPGTGECYHAEAMAATQELVGEQFVLLQRDPNLGTLDEAGNELFYVWLPNGQLLNLALIDQGYAYQAEEIGSPIYQSIFDAALEQAQAEERGLWAAATCGGER